ncbi:MAG: UbiA family prenyltransferase [Acidobacteriaceae bacterium]|nr:UbiA family prenyltransferase [Acidobacteriaceae bacterium]
MFARPRVCVAGALAFYLAWVYAGQSQSWKMVVGMAIAFLLNAIANLFNMYTDIYEDNENIPVRLFYIGLYGRQALLRHTYAVCIAMVVIAISVSPAFLVAVIGGIIGTQQYSFGPLRIKRRPILAVGLFAMAVGYPYLTVLTIVPNGVELLRNRHFIMMVAYLFLWLCCAVVLINNVADYHGDRRAKILTSATLARSRTRAAVVAAIAAIAVYLGLPIFVCIGGLPMRLLWSLLWLLPAVWVCGRLVRYDDPKRTNDALRDNVVVQHGFLATLTLLSSFTAATVLILILGATIIIAADVLKLDTRRREDVKSHNL